MLMLTRRAGQTVRIGDSVEITIVAVEGGKVRIGVNAPRALPVHRGEVVARAVEDNQRALSSRIEKSVADGAHIRFPEGLYGLREHDSFLLCEVDSGLPVRSLVSCRDPSMQLLVVDADVAWPGYPIGEARAQHPTDEEVAVALVATVPCDGRPATISPLSPLVIGLKSRIGKQVILERSGLPVVAALDVGCGLREERHREHWTG